MRNALRNLIAAVLIAVPFGAALAKLPPKPPLTPEQQAQAAAKKKAAAEKEAAELAAAQDRAVANYVANMKAKGVETHAQMPGPERKAPERKAPEHKASEKKK